jgi:hypothetical protein
MTKGRRYALLIVLTVLGLIATVALHLWNHYNPIHHGKRVYAWAEQAIWSDDPSAREEAAAVLVEAMRTMEGEPRTQLVMCFCFPHHGEQDKEPLPKELLPVLLEALRAKDMPPGSYPAMALSQMDQAVAIPALKDMLQHETDPAVRERIESALRFGRFR